MSNGKTATAVFGGGCFWCTEAVFDELRGVQSVISGYAGGATKNPTYEQVCSGSTGHAEVIKIEFDPAQISFRDLMTVFFATHDPTTLNRQGNDAGTQYRSAILYADPQQKAEAAAFIKELDEAKTYTLATNEFMARGGDGYVAFEAGKPLIGLADANLIVSQVIDYVAAKGTVAPAPEGRILIE